MSFGKISAFTVLVLLVFMLIYYPPIVNINTIHILAAFSYLYLMFQRGISDVFKKIIMNYTCSLLGLLLIMFFFSAVIWEKLTVDLGLFVLAIETIPVAYTIADIKNKYASSVDFFNIIICAAIIQSIIAFMTFYIPSFHSLIIGKYISYGFNDIVSKMSGWRMYGYSYTLAYAMPVTHGCIASIAVYKGMKNSWIYFLAAIIIFLSGLINARVSIMIFVLGSIGAVLFSNRISLFHSIKIIAVALFALLMINNGLNYLKNSDSATANWIQSGINDIRNFISGDSLANDSYISYATDAEQYKLPDSIVDIIFGTGYITTRGNTTYKSDVGYINDIWYGGLLYFIWILHFYLYRIRKTFLFFNSKYSVSNKLCYISILILLAANVKGRCFSWNEITQFLLLCMVWAEYEQLSIEKCMEDKTNERKAISNCGYSSI